MRASAAAPLCPRQGPPLRTMARLLRTMAMARLLRTMAMARLLRTMAMARLLRTMTRLLRTVMQLLHLARLL